MNLNELIGRRITDILVWIRSIDGDISETQMYIQIDKSTYIEFPYYLAHENSKLNVDISKKVISLFSEISYYPICFINNEGKTIKRLKHSKSSLRFLKTFQIFSIFDKSKLLSLKNKRQILKFKNQCIASVHVFQLENKKCCLVLEFENGKCLTYSNENESNLLDLFGIQVYADINEAQNFKGNIFQTIQKNTEIFNVVSKTSIA